MTKAHMQGALDFSRSDRYHYHWLLKEQMVLSQLESAALLEIIRLRHDLHAASVSAVPGSEAYAHHFEQAQETLRLAGSILAPWLNWSSKDKQPEEYIRMWEKEFGIKVGSEEWNQMLQEFQQINRRRNLEES